MTLIHRQITGKSHSIQTPKKLAQEVLFSWKKNSNITHPIIYVSNVQVQRANQQKHLDIILEEKFNFKCHIDRVLFKTSRGTVVIKRLQNLLVHKSLFLSFIKHFLKRILTVEIFCTTSLITLLFVKKSNLFNTKQLLQLLVQLKVHP